MDVYLQRLASRPLIPPPGIRLQISLFAQSEHGILSPAPLPSPQNLKASSDVYSARPIFARV